MGLRKKSTIVPTTAPMDPTFTQVAPAEAPTQPVASVAPTPVTPQEPKVVHVPVYLSQDQVNNLVIENNLMLKEILAQME